LLLTVLGGLADFERDLIKARTGEGRRRALGRRSSLTPHQQQEVLRRRAEGESLTELAKSYGVTHPTIIRTLRKHEAVLT
jgi:DNA invertase Pin-like site-specific DNA recombinase